MEKYVEVVEEPKIEIEMTPIPGGTLKMGSPPDEHEYRKDYEGPQFDVKVEPFWMATYEITWDQYDQFLKQYDLIRSGDREPVIPEGSSADAVSLPTPQYEEGIEEVMRMGREGGYPAVDMTQLAAKQFTKWLSKKTGRFYRLPTEAEWEYACRAGANTAYHFGGDESKVGEYGWHADNSPPPGAFEGEYHKVGEKKPNKWGLYDMHGNVAEYVIDQFRPDHYKKMKKLQEELGGPVPWKKAIAWPKEDEQYGRVVRGGSWNHFPDELRCACRFHSKKDWKQRDPQLPQSIWWHTEAFWVGFRVVRPLNPPESEEEKRKFWEPKSEYVRDLMLSYDDDGSKELRILLEEDASQE
jgi:formylglycine-generating enzyme required for sulfatase activity